MKPWHSPQSHQFEELFRALKNALAMVGFMSVVLVLISVFGSQVK